ncbi:DUF4344 domain-containing metallopeptidase [Nonomuraea sp. WAC 01424]|uniref:DUF4344 domain-containing metallopeptidase n=1 Tax=Nonomuraea sp. WAC 01424 TaxID=2203200 RepID=UPI00163CEF98|nr:DUF4344 domain-containing metallopeptidase [Nonomuraea sp. WAC 01424]
MPNPLIALVLSLTSTLGTAPSVRYEPAGTARDQHARKLLKDSGVLRTRLDGVEVVARGCDSPRATWNDGKRRITICYSLVTKINRTITGISETEEADSRTTPARVDGALAALYHHQLGHALAALNGLPGDGEQADRFAALTLTARDSRHVVAAAEARHLLAAHTDADHLSGTAASATFACLLYGADPAKYARIAKGGWVPAERAPSCRAEYDRARSDLGSLAVKVGA